MSRKGSLEGGGLSQVTWQRASEVGLSTDPSVGTYLAGCQAWLGRSALGLGLSKPV